MKKMKKIVALALVTALVAISTAGCGGASDSAADTTAGTVAETKEKAEGFWELKMQNLQGS